MAELLNVRVLSPSAILFDGTAKEVSVPTKLGYIGIRYNHNALVSGLGVGRLDIPGQDEKSYFISGGYVEVSENTVTILVDVIEEIASIDPARAEAAEKRAEARLKAEKAQEQLDIGRALSALERARARRKLAGISKLH